VIEYVIEHNPDDRILERASRIVEAGGLLCFPTETNWVVVCNPFDKNAVDKLYRLRHIENTKHLTVLCSNFSHAMEIAFVGDGAFALMKKVVPGPYTFIFEAQKKITKFLKASKIDHQVGIRFPPNKLTKAIIEKCGGILLSSHLSHEMIEESNPDFPLYSALIEDHLGNLIDLIIDPGEVEFKGPTTIVDFSSGVPEVQRVGAGNPDLFT
jgi:tRNA threonylcarbamoyl adenosine modification protein (Sua5/YciO/YrdC/YwlC family)